MILPVGRPEIARPGIVRVAEGDLQLVAVERVDAREVRFFVFLGLRIDELDPLRLPRLFEPVARLERRRPWKRDLNAVGDSNRSGLCR